MDPQHLLLQSRMEGGAEQGLGGVIPEMGSRVSPRLVTTLKPFWLSLEEARRGHKEGVCKPCRRAFSAHIHPGYQTGSEWGQAPTPPSSGMQPAGGVEGADSP